MSIKSLSTAGRFYVGDEISTSASQQMVFIRIWQCMVAFFPFGVVDKAPCDVCYVALLCPTNWVFFQEQSSPYYCSGWGSQPKPNNPVWNSMEFAGMYNVQLRSNRSLAWFFWVVGKAQFSQMSIRPHRCFWNEPIYLSEAFST